MPCERSEFRLKNFGFSNITYDRIFFSQWIIPPFAVIIYKLILSIYVTVWMVLLTNHLSSYPPYVWLTTWTYILLAVHLNVSTLATIVYHLVRIRHRPARLWSLSPDEHQRLMQDGESHNYAEISLDFMEDEQESSPDPALIRSPWVVAVPWILRDMACSCVPCVTFLFFFTVWPYIHHPDGIDNDNLQLHAINTVCMMLDFALDAVPVRILHAIYPIIYGLIYAAFSLIYWAGDHNRVIYPGLLDWNNPGLTVGIISGIMAALVVLQLIFFGLHKLKTYIYYRLFCSEQP